MIGTAATYVDPMTGTFPLANSYVTQEWAVLGTEPFQDIAQESELLEGPWAVLKGQPEQDGPAASISKPP